MPQTVRLRDVRRVGGRIYIHFTDKTGLEFNALADLRAFAASVEEDPQLLKKLILAYWLKRNADGSDPAQIQGKALTLDLAGTILLEVS